LKQHSPWTQQDEDGNDDGNVSDEFETMVGV
jgi:hypothetical protein